MVSPTNPPFDSVWTQNNKNIEPELKAVVNLLCTFMTSLENYFQVVTGCHWCLSDTFKVLLCVTGCLVGIGMKSTPHAPPPAK